MPATQLGLDCIEERRSNPASLLVLVDADPIQVVGSFRQRPLAITGKTKELLRVFAPPDNNKMIPTVSIALFGEFVPEFLDDVDISRLEQIDPSR